MLRNKKINDNKSRDFIDLNFYNFELISSCQKSLSIVTSKGYPIRKSVRKAKVTITFRIIITVIGYSYIMPSSKCNHIIFAMID